MFLKPMSSNTEKSILITAKSFSQRRPISVNPLFNPILDAHGDVMRAMPNLGTLVSDQLLFNPNGEDVNLNGEDQEVDIQNQIDGEAISFVDVHEDAVLNAKPMLAQPLFEDIPEDCEESMSSLRDVTSPTHSQYESEFIPEIKMGYLNGWSRYGRGKWLVLLLEDPSHTEELVSTTIPVIFPCLTAWNARALLEISRQQGYAVVIVAARLEHAVFYVQEMRDYGLRADFVQSKK